MQFVRYTQCTYVSIAVLRLLVTCYKFCNAAACLSYFSRAAACSVHWSKQSNAAVYVLHKVFVCKQCKAAAYSLNASVL